jgi:drug/metabolite transporter (DMT)-like permease
MIKTIAFILFALVLEAIGVVYLSQGLKQIGEAARLNFGEILRVVKAGVTNGNILLGVALETAFFICLLVLLSRRDVSFIWPLTAMGFVLTTFAAKYILHEQVSAARWLGVVFIMIGAGFITWSEQQKKLTTDPKPPASVSRPAE